MSSFDEYVRERGAALLRFAYLLCGDAHLAEDLVQEGLARCHRAWRRITDGGEPEAYVRKAVLRQYLSWLRRRSSGERAVAEPAAYVRSRPDGSEEVAGRDLLWRLLGGLPRMQRAVLVLRFYEDMAYPQIAELLGIREATVRVHVHKGLSALRVSPRLDEITR